MSEAFDGALDSVKLPYFHRSHDIEAVRQIEEASATCRCTIQTTAQPAGLFSESSP